MKVILIGAFCILWLQNSCAAPKWTGDAAGDTFGDDLDLHTDMDFSDMELDIFNMEHDNYKPTPNKGFSEDIDLHMDMDFSNMELDLIEYDYHGETTYTSFQIGYDEKGTPEIQVEPIKCTVKPPSLFWIGFTMLRLMIAAWFLTLLGSLGGCKKDVGSVNSEGDDSEKGPLTEEPVAGDTVDDTNMVEEAPLVDMLQGVLKAEDYSETEPAVDPKPNNLKQVPDNENKTDDGISKEAKDIVDDQYNMEQVEEILEEPIQDEVDTENGTELEVTMGPEDKLERAPDTEEETEAKIVANQMVPNHSGDTVKDIDQVEALLENLLQEVEKKVNQELNMDTENNSNIIVTNIPLIGDQNPKLADEIKRESSEESEMKASEPPSSMEESSDSSLVSMETIRKEFRSKSYQNQKLEDAIEQESFEELEMNASEPSSSMESSSDNSLISMETVRKEFLSKPKEGSRQSGSEVSPEEIEKPPKNSKEMPGKKKKSPNVFKRAFRAVFKRKKSSGKKQDVPEPAERPPGTQRTIFKDKKDWLALKNRMWAIAPDRPSEYRPKVSFCDEVEVKTFQAEKPMHSLRLRRRSVRND